MRTDIKDEIFSRSRVDPVTIFEEELDIKTKVDFGIMPKINSNAFTKIVTGLTKREIRSKILLKLKTQKEEDRKKKSRVIKGKLFRLSVFKRAKRVMFYLSFDGEVNTQEMIKEAIKLGKMVAVPVCRGVRAMKPCRLSPRARLIKGPYGVKEPAIKRFVKLEDLDLVIVPGVAFDKSGNRLGRGKGCYDYFLKKIPKRIPSIGLAFAFQILPSLPATSEDVSVKKILFS